MKVKLTPAIAAFMALDGIFPGHAASESVPTAAGGANGDQSGSGPTSTTVLRRSFRDGVGKVLAGSKSLFKSASSPAHHMHTKHRNTDEGMTTTDDALGSGTHDVGLGSGTHGVGLGSGTELGSGTDTLFSPSSFWSDIVGSQGEGEGEGQDPLISLTTSALNERDLVDNDDLSSWEGLKFINPNTDPDRCIFDNQVKNCDMFEDTPQFILWMHDPKGRIYTEDDNCLTAVDSNKLAIETCGESATQVWTRTSDGQLYNEQSNKVVAKENCDSLESKLVLMEESTVPDGCDLWSVTGPEKHDPEDFGSTYFKKLQNLSPQDATDDSFASSVSMNDDGSVVAIGGSSLATDTTDYVGAVTVYQRSGNTWTKKDSYKLEDLKSGSKPKVEVTVSGDGKKLAIAVASTNDNGAIQVLEYNGSTLSKLGSLIQGESSGELPGLKLAMDASGSTLVIGEPYYDGSDETENAGRVRIYNFDSAQSEYTIDTSKELIGTKKDDLFGSAVSINRKGELIAVGSAGMDADKDDKGSVSVIRLVDDTWEDFGPKIFGEAENDEAGHSIKIVDFEDKVHLAFGATYNDGNNQINSGHVRVYQCALSNCQGWTQVGKDIDGDNGVVFDANSFHVGDGFGFSLDMSEKGDTLIIGAPFHSASRASDYYSGSVKLYKFDSSLDDWEQVGHDIVGDGNSETSGYSVGMSKNGNVIVIGSPGEQTGSAQIYSQTEVSNSPSKAPSDTPSKAPSYAPSKAPSDAPSKAPSKAPSSKPTTAAPSSEPTVTSEPSASPAPSTKPSTSSAPTVSSQPSNAPSTSSKPSASPAPSFKPSTSPAPTTSSEPSELPSRRPSDVPSDAPSDSPSSKPTATVPTTKPTVTSEPSASPAPSTKPSTSSAPTVSSQPSNAPSTSSKPSTSPAPSTKPSTSSAPTVSSQPSNAPSTSTKPSTSPAPSSKPSTSSAPTTSSVPTTSPSVSSQPTAVSLQTFLIRTDYGRFDKVIGSKNNWCIQASSGSNRATLNMRPCDAESDLQKWYHDANKKIRLAKYKAFAMKYQGRIMKLAGGNEPQAFTFSEKAIYTTKTNGKKEKNFYIGIDPTKLFSKLRLYKDGTDNESIYTWHFDKLSSITESPSEVPTLSPSKRPSLEPSATPSLAPSFGPSLRPSAIPSVVPSVMPSPTTKTCATGIGKDYRGTINETKSGILCQRWDETIPHVPIYTPEEYPDDDLVENYCRNPSDYDGGLWCYTTDPNRRWEVCDVPSCPEPMSPSESPSSLPPTSCTESTCDWNQLGSSIVGDTNKGQIFQNAIAFSTDGTRMAYGERGWSGELGMVRVFQYDGTSWNQLGQSMEGEQAGEGFFRCRLSGDGGTVVVGSVWFDEGGKNVGKVTVHRLTNNVWTKLGGNIVGEGASDYFSYGSLSQNGKRVVASGYGHNDQTGHLKVYDLVNDTWQQVGSTINGKTTGERFGGENDISGDGSRIITGASRGGIGGAGYAEIFEWRNGSWTSIMSFLELEGSDAECGARVAASADGSRFAYSCPGVGKVIVFDVGAGMSVGGAITGEFSGRGIDLSSDGSRIAIAAPLVDNDTGKVGVLEYNAGTNSWEKVAAPILGEAVNDQLGFSVRISGDGKRVAANAGSRNSPQGQVRVYELEPSP